jgi:hypothetical protein
LENLVITAGEGMQKHPVEWAGSQSDVKFVVVEKGLVKMLEYRVIYIVFSESEKQAPRDDRG